MAGKVSKVTYSLNDDGTIHSEAHSKGDGKNRGAFLMSDNVKTGSHATPKAAAQHLLSSLGGGQDPDPSDAPKTKKTKVNDSMPASDDDDGASDRGM